MDLRIDGRVAVVTGAASGIGFCTAKLLAAEGARVIITDHNQEHLDEAASILNKDGYDVGAVVADVRDTESVASLSQQVHTHFGKVEILMHAAGITGAQGSFADLSDDDWYETIDTNLMGSVRVVRAFLADLRDSGHGRIVLVASEDAVQPYSSELPYSTAKAGVLALMKGLSRDYADEGLVVNALSPAFIHSPMTDRMMDARARALNVDRDEAIASFLKEERPFLAVGRRGEPEEVASVAALLCSQNASFVNGANYRVDGGSVATF